MLSKSFKYQYCMPAGLLDISDFSTLLLVIVILYYVTKSIICWKWASHKAMTFTLYTQIKILLWLVSFSLVINCCEKVSWAGQLQRPVHNTQFHFSIYKKMPISNLKFWSIPFHLFITMLSKLIQNFREKDM